MKCGNKEKKKNVGKMIVDAIERIFVCPISYETSCVSFNVFICATLILDFIYKMWFGPQFFPL